MKKEEKIIAHFALLVHKKRLLGVQIIEALLLISRHNVHLQLGYPTLFAFLTEKFHFSESEAYKKIQAMKLSQKYPQILKYLKVGSLNLSGVGLLSSTLLMENCPFKGSELIEKSLGQKKRSIEVMIKELWQQYKDQRAAAPKLILQTPVPVIATTESEKKNNTALLPQTEFKFMPNALTPQEEKKVERLLKNCRLNVSLDDQQLSAWQEAKVHFSSKHPKGLSDQVLVEELLAFYLKEKNKTQTRSYKIIKEKSSPQNRYLSLSLKNSLHKRAQGKCQFKGPQGKRCLSTWNLQFDHQDPYSLGGGHTQQNLRLLCGNHHRYLSQELRPLMV